MSLLKYLKNPLNLKITYVLFLSHFWPILSKNNVPEQNEILSLKIGLTDFEDSSKLRPAQKTTRSTVLGPAPSSRRKSRAQGSGDVL